MIIPFSFPLVFNGLIASYTRYNSKQSLDIICVGTTQNCMTSENELPFDQGNAFRYVRGKSKFPKKRIISLHELPPEELVNRIKSLMIYEPQTAVSRFHFFLMNSKQVIISEETKNQLSRILELESDPLVYIAKAMLASFNYDKKLTHEQTEYIVDELPALLQNIKVENAFSEKLKSQSKLNTSNNQQNIYSKMHSIICGLCTTADYIYYSDLLWELFGLINKPSPAKTRLFLRFYLHELFLNTVEEDIGIVIFGLDECATLCNSLLSRREYYLENSFYLNLRQKNNYFPYSWCDEQRKQKAISMLVQDEERIIDIVVKHLIDLYFDSRDSLLRTPEGLSTEVNLLCSLAEKQFAAKGFNDESINCYYDEKKYGKFMSFNLKGRILPEGEFHNTLDDPFFPIYFNPNIEDEYTSDGIIYDFEIYFKNTFQKPVSIRLTVEQWPQFLEQIGQATIIQNSYCPTGIRIDFQEVLNSQLTIDPSGEFFVRFKSQANRLADEITDSIEESQMLTFQIAIMDEFHETKKLECTAIMISY